MITGTPLKIVQIVFAAAMVIANALAMTPASATPRFDCQHVHASSSASNDHHPLPAVACCSDMHCCPMLPDLRIPGQPKQLGYQYQSLLKVVQPLLLIRPIDPPPRTLPM